MQSVPVLSPTRIVQMVKSITAKEIFRRAPSVKTELQGGAFWSSAYFSIHSSSTPWTATVARKRSAAMSRSRTRRGTTSASTPNRWNYAEPTVTACTRVRRAIPRSSAATCSSLQWFSLHTLGAFLKNILFLRPTT